MAYLPFRRSGRGHGGRHACRQRRERERHDLQESQRGIRHVRDHQLAPRSISWEVIWESLATPYMLEYNPRMYYQWQQRFRWQYDLYRTPSGAFHFHRDHGSLDPIDEGICLALAFTAPLKTLYITGARSKFAREFTLPEKLWGNEADLAFLSSKHNPDYYKYGKDEEIHIPYWQLPVDLRYDPEEVSKLPVEMLLKNVRHARFEVRAAAAKALCMNKHYRELEELLRDPIPASAGPHWMASTTTGHGSPARSLEIWHSSRMIHARHAGGDHRDDE